MIPIPRPGSAVASVGLTLAMGASLAASQAPATTPAAIDPASITVSLVPEKTSLMPGEPIYLSFILHNNSTQDLQVVVGNDTWNVLGRPERFTIQVVRDDDVRIPIRALPPVTPAGNRFVGPEKIPAGGSYSFSLFLPDWVEFKEPGYYTITAARTLDVRDYDRHDMTWTNPATLDHIDRQAGAKVTVVPFDRAAFGQVILARGRVMLGPEEAAAMAAAKALAAIDDDRAIEALSRAVAESGYSVKFIAVGALARFTSDAALSALARAGADGNDNIRLAAAASLSRSASPAAITALLAMRTDAYWGVRNTVLQTLATMTPPASTELIREMTHDPDERIRIEALRYLKLRTGRATDQRMDMGALAQASDSNGNSVAQPQEAAARDASLATPTGHEMSAGVSRYTNSEPGAQSIAIHGRKITGDYLGTMALNRRRHLFAQAELRGTLGNVTYDGWCSPFLITPNSASPNGYLLDLGDPSPCSESGDRDWSVEGRVLAGKDLIGQRWGWSPHSGLGVRHLSNGTTGTAGYRTDDYLYVPVGVTARTSVASHRVLSFTIEYDRLLHGWQKTRDSELGGGDVPATPTAPAFTISDRSL